MNIKDSCYIYMYKKGKFTGRGTKKMVIPVTGREGP
jgi:hypothetical protein